MNNRPGREWRKCKLVAWRRGAYSEIRRSVSRRSGARARSVPSSPPMALRAVVVDVEPNPMRVAARFAGRRGFAFLHAASNGDRVGPSYVAFDPLEASASWLPPGCEDGPSMHLDTRAGAPRWIGAVPYECGRSIERRAWTRAPDARPFSHL